MEITVKPTLKQHEAYEALRTPGVKNVFLGGGAGGGKSWFICESRLLNALLYPGYKSFIGRNELKRLMQSTYLTMMKVFKYHGVPESEWKLDGKYNFIEFKNGSRIDLLDLKLNPSDPLFERFGSLEYTDGAIEEAGEVNFGAYDVLKSRVGRHENDVLGLQPTILATGNPKNNWTKRIFYKPWKEGTLPSDTVFIQSLYSDNPHTAKSYEEQLSQLSSEQAKQRLKFGNWDYDDDPEKLFEGEAVTDLFSNTIVLGKEKYITADIARFGQDSTVITLWQGLQLQKIWKYENSAVDWTAEQIKIIARDNQVPYSHIIVDEDGVGGGVKDILKGIKGFVANSSPLDTRGGKVRFQVPVNFKNLKAQCYFKLADLVNSHKISIKIDDELIKDAIEEELAVIKQKDVDNDGKLQVNKKSDQKEVLGRSPDLADALMMRMYFEVKPVKGEPPLSEIQRIAQRRRTLVKNPAF